VVLVFVLVPALAACRAEVGIDIDVADDGSGEVLVVLELDPVAAGSLLDVATGLQLEDLARAGWVIEPPEVQDDGWTRVSAAKTFGLPEQLPEILDEIDGPDGLLRSFRLERTHSFARIDYRLSGVLDPTGGIDQFADAELEALLGTDLSALAEEAGIDGSEISVTLRARLPGEVRSETPTGTTVPGDRAVGWTVTLADSAPVSVDLAATTRLVAPLVLRGVAVVAAVLAGLVLLGQILRLIRPEARRPAVPPRPRVPARGVGAGPAPAPVASSTEPAPGPVPPPRVVALDAMGVLYREGDDIRQLLVPFARQRGSLRTEAEIEERARALSLGRITPADFWAQVGVPGDPNELDREYLQLIQLNPGVVRFLRTMRERGIRAACITNDAAAWATALRRRHSLDGLIDLWVVSGAVGVRKPDRPIFEALRRLAQVQAGDIMMVDDDRSNLDAARSLGFRTAWFAPDGDEDDANGHPILRSLEVSAAEETATSAQPSGPS
jgi:HAD superfamily hydrolase (TIGR01509 family)